MQSPDSSFSKGASLAAVFPSVSESAQVDITARNRQIFRRYAKTFASLNDPAFGEHAAKFAVWLSSPRGYYETARPEIVKLLMIMHNAMRKAVNHPESQHVQLPLEAYRHLQMSHLYIQLVNTVHRFAYLFTEPNLQSLLKGLFFSVDLQYTPNTGAVQDPATSSSPVGTSHLAPSLVSPQQYALNPTQTVGDVSSNQSAFQNTFSHTVKMETSQPTIPNLQHGNGGSSSGPRVRKRKRKTLDLESLAEMDLKNYIEKQEKAQIQLPLPGSGAQAVSEDLPTAPAASSGSGVSQLPEVGAAHVALNQPPHEVIEILDSPVDDDAPAASVAAVGGEQAETAISRTAPGQPPPSESYVIDLTLSAGNDGPSANPDAMQVDEEPTPPEDSTPNAILDNLHSMDAEVLPVLSEMPSQPEEVPQDPPELALDNETDSDSVAEANMEVDSGGLTSIPEPLPPDAIPLEEEEEMAIPQEISITGQTFVEKLPQSTAREASPMTNGDEAHGPIISEPTKEEEEEEEEEEVVEEDEKQEAVVAILLPIPDERIYGDEMKVLACQRGLKSNSRIRFTFDVGEDYLEPILAWSKHDAPIAKLRSTLCISLGCYPASHIKLSEPIAPQITQLQSSWPDGGGLSIKFTYNSEIQSFSLSPPLLISPDNTVDLSMFVQPGHNTFEISQHRNWSEHVFILLAHHPTGNQIQKAEAKKEEDEAWNNWLEEMAKPIVVKFPPVGYKGTIDPNREEPRGILVSSEA